ncbi:MAG: type II toxin-antitoxin system Phd/YefM family antitoxin [Planctomycetes bacterium]|nr:type II toxin-antitoxin system Phd/YefM family antitoxin [Planctomycetota bacterium]
MPATRETASKARQSFSEVLNRAAYGKERVVIERRGKRLAAVVPLEDLALLEELEDRIDLEDARKRLKERGSIPWSKVKKDLGL